MLRFACCTKPMNLVWATFVVTCFGLACATSTMAKPAMITIQVNGDDPITITDAPADVSGGSYQYLGEYADPDGHWIVSWDKLVDPNPEITASILGNIQVKNTSNALIDYKVTFETILCPVIENESLSGAFVVVSLTTGTDGGELAAVDGEPIWALLADGQVAQSIYDAPFLVASSGQGTATLSASFGTPFPSAGTLPVESSAAVRYKFMMTDGETVNFHTQLYIGAEDQNLADCQDEKYPLGDLNMDGVVDLDDLLILLWQWGKCSQCLADLNGDDVVDQLDLFILLSNWG